jgi:hypothetical protein
MTEFGRHLVDLSSGSLDRRVVRVQQAIRNPIFASALHRALAREEQEAPITDLDHLRGIVRSVLAADFGLDVAGVLLTFAWDAETKRLDVWCRTEATPEQVAEAATNAGTT